MLHPNMFKINEAWIMFRLNEVPISTKEDGDFNAFALMDAASCFILASEFVSVISAELSEMEANRLLKKGKSHKQQLPKKLYIPDNQVADILRAVAERSGITVVRVPEDQLHVFISETREGFKEQLGGGSLQ